MERRRDQRPAGPGIVCTVDRAAAEEWIRAHVRPVGPVELLRERPWATVLRVPVAGGAAWFKACAPVQAFEPRLTAGLAARWPDLVAEVLGYDPARAWLLLADAGTPLRDCRALTGGRSDKLRDCRTLTGGRSDKLRDCRTLTGGRSDKLRGPGNPPDAWLRVLPRYAELQRGEAGYAAEHLAHGVPDRRVAVLPARYEDLLCGDLPLEPDGIGRLRRFAPRFARLCAELAGCGIPDTVQHDDLHMANVYARDGRLRVLDWGDASIAHPFASLLVTYRFLAEHNGLPPGDPWYHRLRDAYLEPWGTGLAGVFDLAIRVGRFAYAIALARHRAHLPESARPEFDRWYREVLGRAVALTDWPPRGPGRTTA
jgi:hypothetical protein